MPKPRAATWVGLFIALFGLLIVRWAVALFFPPYSFDAVLWKEGLIWLCVGAIFFIIRRGENLPLRSIHLGNAQWWKSILWGFVIMLVCGLVGAVISILTHFQGGEMAASFSRLPLWLVFLIVVRAGVAEELFYRGFAIERLQQIGLNRSTAVIIPLLIFGLAHWTNGWENAVLALALGAVLTIFYLWRRDLAANMIGHFLIDFVGVVLPRLIAHR